MLGLGKHGPDGRYGVVVDIGSGSVGVAIVASDPLEDLPKIVWSHREWTTIHDFDKIEVAAKDITTTTMGVFLILESVGGKALREYDKSAKLTSVQATIAAPWSYTITKTVSTSHDDPFEITKAVVDELITAAQTETLEVMKANDFMAKLGLQIINETTIGTTANGYILKNPLGQKVKSLSLTQLTGVTEKRLIETLENAVGKMFSKIDTQHNTFIYQFYLALQNLLPETTEICLVDVTGEATEIGIVRDGILRYVTHTPTGSRSLIRSISGLCAIPKAEAEGFLRSNDTSLEDSLSTSKKEELEAIVDGYVESLSDLLSRTGDALSIPNTIFLHTDALTEDFFRQCLIKAGKKANSIEHSVHPITSKIFPKSSTDDTAILLSAYVFHKKLHKPNIIN